MPVKTCHQQGLKAMAGIKAHIFKPKPAISKLLLVHEVETPSELCALTHDDITTTKYTKDAKEEKELNKCEASLVEEVIAFIIFKQMTGEPIQDDEWDADQQKSLDDFRKGPYFNPEPRNHLHRDAIRIDFILKEKARENCTGGKASTTRKAEEVTIDAQVAAATKMAAIADADKAAQVELDDIDAAKKMAAMAAKDEAAIANEVAAAKEFNEHVDAINDANKAAQANNVVK
jgi:hypothetical protein